MKAEAASKPNAAPLLHWLLAATSPAFYIIVAWLLAEDFLPFMTGRMLGYLILILVIGASCWLWGWLTRELR